MKSAEELKTSDFYFELPQELIAQDPLEDRSASRLLVLNKETGETSHHVFKEIPDFWKKSNKSSHFICSPSKRLSSA